MANLSIKDVPEVWAEALRQRALRNHRSLQGELLAMVEGVVVSEANASRSSAMPEPLNSDSKAKVSPQLQQNQRIKSIEQIASELKIHVSRASLAAPKAVDLVRADRDVR